MIVEVYATAGSGHEEATAVKVAIVGAGDSGKAIKRALQATGAQVTLHSRRTGFDVLRDDGTAALSGADVIVEATGRFTTSKRVATDFFTRSTRAVSAAANALGARHVLLSIVNCDLPEVQGYGYFAGKRAQERLKRLRELPEQERADIDEARATLALKRAIARLQTAKAAMPGA